ncbi:MAG: hypothetical protein WCR71_04190, partial [Bacteroidales bacterium]
ARRNLQKQSNYLVMNEYVKDEWRLTTLEENEETIAGGLSLTELWRLANFLGNALKKAEKYWPSFKHGFVEGWEAA